MGKSLWDKYVGGIEIIMEIVHAAILAPIVIMLCLALGVGVVFAGWLIISHYLISGG